MGWTAPARRHEAEVDDDRRRRRVEQRQVEPVGVGRRPAREVPGGRRRALARSLGPTRRAVHRLGHGDAATREDHRLGLPRARREGGDGRRHDAVGRDGDGRPCSEAPPSLTDVIVPLTERAVVLVRTRKPGDTPEALDCPVQYQADDSASGAPTSALGAGRRAEGSRRPPGPGDAHPDDHHHDEGEHRPPALGAVMGRGHGSGARRAVPVARRGRAARGGRQDHPGRELEQHGQGDVGELREREGGLALASRRTGPPSRTPAAARTVRPSRLSAKLPAGA